MREVSAYAAKSATTPLEFHKIPRRDVTELDVGIDILYCGVCHSDIHLARNEWDMASMYPMVPGHEIIGRVSEVGSKVSKYKVGDLVGVGCMVDSCQSCRSCADDLEQYCETGATFTYNAEYSKFNEMTYGGYSKAIVVTENFVVKVPENIDPQGAAPLLCAGITVWSPLKRWNVGKGMKVGVVGLGGLGHMGVKLAKALGAHVVMVTRSPDKGEDARKLGADEVVLSTNEVSMQESSGSFDFLLNTIPSSHDLNPYLDILKRDGTMVLVGAIEKLQPGLDGAKVIFGRKIITGSLIGGIKETQEMLDFCGEHNIVSDYENLEIKDINKAYERVLKSDVKYRFVIDLATL